MCIISRIRRRYDIIPIHSYDKKMIVLLDQNCKCYICNGLSYEKNHYL